MDLDSGEVQKKIGADLQLKASLHLLWVSKPINTWLPSDTSGDLLTHWLKSNWVG